MFKKLLMTTALALPLVYSAAASGRSFALQPVSLEGSVAINVTLGLSGLQLRAI